ncbi:hypothetical protein L2744_00175 [Shewanella profunda]|uniref:hypothetical protein n=1 Tax=Shewanella profunda TaxID=254793 RepID=UPI00200F918B|nr:hypothetical protein [Shewanella profunda]MCL1088048.1 hypothetical protein [Shewanella profunda]
MSYADEVLVKVALNQLSDKCASDKAAIPNVGAKPKFPNWNALNQLTDKCAHIEHTPEEDAEFERIERNQAIALMANVIRTAPTTSAEGIATRMFEAGYRFDSSKVEV